MKLKYIFLIGFAALTLLSCKTKQTKSTSQHVPKEHQYTKTELEFSAQLIDAVKEKNIGNLDEAEKMLSDLHRKSPENHAVSYQLANVKLLQEKTIEAISMAELALKESPDNQWYLNLLGDLYMEIAEYAKAYDIWTQLLKKYPDQQEYYYNLVISCVYQGKWEEAAKTYDLLEKKNGVSEELALAKQRIWLHLKKVDKAVAEIQKLVDLYPRESRYYLMIGDLYMEQKMPEDAKKQYDKALKADSTNPYIYSSLAEYYRKNGERDKSFENLKMAFKNPKMDIDTKIKVMLSYYSITEVHGELLEDAFTLSKLMIDAHPQEPKAWSMYGDFLIRDKKYEEARKAFMKVLEVDKSKYIIWEQLLMILSYEEDINNMLKYSTEALDYFPSQPYLFMIKGIAHYQLGEYENAQKAFEFGRNMLITNDETAMNIWIYLGETYNKLKNYPKSDDAFDRALRMNSNNVYVLNNYCYYLALRNEKIDKALEMGERLNKLQKYNASYQDTYGWVLYRAERHEDARKWLEKSIANGGDSNPEILEHYGDILWKLGEVDKAVIQWEKAMEEGGFSETLEQKIKEQKGRKVTE